jgi:hypothetical protein
MYLVYWAFVQSGVKLCTINVLSLLSLRSIWGYDQSRLSNLTTQCCTEYHMITIVKLDHTMLYRVPYDHHCQTWPHNVVPSTIWSRLSNFITYVVPSTTWWRSRRPLNLYYNHVITTAKMWYLIVKLCIFKHFQIKYIHTCIKKHW